MPTKNAAHLLAQMLESFAVPNGHHAQKSHGFQDATDVDAWRAHIEALTLARNVDDILHGLAQAGVDTSLWKPSVPAWYAGVGMATTPWDSAVGHRRPACNDEDLRMLKTLGMYLDARGCLTIDEAERRTLTDVLEEARELLASDDLIPDDIRAYLTALLDRADFVLTNIETYGAETLRSVALELGGALVTQGATAEAAGQAEKATRWRSLGWLAVTGFMSATAGEGAKATIQGVGQIAKQIGSS